MKLAELAKFLNVNKEKLYRIRNEIVYHQRPEMDETEVAKICAAFLKQETQRIKYLKKNTVKTPEEDIHCSQCEREGFFG